MSVIFRKFFFLFLLFGITPYSYAGLVGTTQGSFDVNSNGAATYSIPIQIPPGINGLTPRLGLVYNSQKGNGLLGVGWSLSGLSSISRCRANIAQDGFRAGIKFDAERFCLNGNRLINVGSGTDNEGVYRDYKTQLETFKKIRAYGTSVTAPTEFMVWTKAGQKKTFGGTADSKHAAETSILSWNVSRVEDQNGNYYTVSYDSNNETGEQYPGTITYTGNVSAGLTANRKIIFGYGQALVLTAQASQNMSMEKVPPSPNV